MAWPRWAAPSSPPSLAVTQSVQSSCQAVQMSSLCSSAIRTSALPVSPVLMPGSADVLIALEQSEVLRTGFLDLLRPEGIILLATTRIVPTGLAGSDYPDEQLVDSALSPYRVVKADVLGKALQLGDPGRMANVVMLGLLSTVAPFDAFPEEHWLEALRRASPQQAIWAANHTAFNAGRHMESRVAR